MKKLLGVLLLLLSVSLASSAGVVIGIGPSSFTSLCPTGFTCDAKGWTQFSVGPGGFCEGFTGACANGTLAANATRIIYVSTAGTDQGCPSSCTANAGDFAHPIFSVHIARDMVRDGSPDWVLLRCGDLWTNESPTVISSNHGGSGLNQGNPKLWSSYDPNASHNPPVPHPDSCSARPQMNIDSAASGVSGYPGAVSIQDSVPMHDIAIVGFKFYAWKRDPLNANYSTAESQQQIVGISVSMSGTFTNLLLEDNWLGYTTGGTSISVGTYRPNLAASIFIRRNHYVWNYDICTGCNATGYLIGGVNNGPTGYVLYGNTVDHSGWACPAGGCTINGHTITWADANGFIHDLYLTGAQVNGDAASTSTPPTVRGNIIANDPSASAIRQSILATDNLWLHSPAAFGFIQTQAFQNLFNWNVILNGTAGNGCCSRAGFIYDNRYINEDTTVGSSITNNNIIAHNVEDTGTNAILISAGVNNQSLTGNIIFNWANSSPSVALATTTGAIWRASVTAPGSGYTDLSAAIFSAQSSNTPFTSGPGCPTPSTTCFVWPGDGQDYVVLKFASGQLNNVALYGSVYTTAGGLNGLYQASILDETCSNVTHTCGAGTPQYLILYGTNFTALGGTTFTGTLYYPWYSVSLTGGAGSGAQADLISAGGQIKAMYLNGSDNQWNGEPKPLPGSGYVNGNVLSATPGTACKNTTTGPAVDSGCVGGWSFNGSSATGSGLQITVDPSVGIAVNPVAATGCNLSINNVVDGTGANGCTFSDPGRSVGSYYATLPGSTASATFTGVVANGVLTVSGITGTLSLGDAITWGGQTKQDYIKFNSGSAGTPCNGAPCTGSTGNGTYALTGLNTTVGSGPMLSWTLQQFLTLVETNQSKSNWNTNLTACAVNKYINAGFGVTDPCTP